MSESSLLRKAMGVFVELDEPTAQTQPANQPVSATPVQTSKPQVPSYAGVDPEMAKALNAVVANRKTAYTALLESADRLKTVIPDEATRIKAAFAVITADGRTLDSIVQAIDLHLVDIDGEAMRFKRASEANSASKVGASRTKVTNLQAVNQNAYEAIKNLEAEIATKREVIQNNEAEIARLDQEASIAEAEIASVSQRFTTTLEAVKADLSSKKVQLSSVLA